MEVDPTVASLEDLEVEMENDVKPGLFDAAKEIRCAGCWRVEPGPLPGWPLNGYFLTVGRSKLCLGCLKEAQKKLEAVGIRLESGAQQTRTQ